MPYIAEVAALIGDPARANMLCSLKNERQLSATELACAGGVAASTASGHLSKLVEGKLVSLERRGRNRFYRLASPAVADALEALEALAVNAAHRHMPASPKDDAIRFARSCYDHLGGKLGVELARAMMHLDCVKETDGGYCLARDLPDVFAKTGLDVPTIGKTRRKTVIACMDWTEGAPHLGGAFGAALFTQFLAKGWLRRRSGTRAVSLTPAGRTALRELFGIDLSRLWQNGLT